MDVEAGRTCRMSAGQTPRCSTMSHTQSVTTPPPRPANTHTQSPSYYITPQNINLTHHLHPLCSTLKDDGACFSTFSSNCTRVYAITSFQKMLQFLVLFNTVRTATALFIPLQSETQDSLLWQKMTST